MSKFFAWSVHAYTAAGLVVSAFIMLALLDMTPSGFRTAFLLMALATAIDATDGMFARMAHVKTVLPQFNGRRLDDIIDFLNFTALPLLLVYQARILPSGTEWCLLLPLVASIYGFCQENAKTDDGYFLGFPSYWNIVAFYLYVLRPPAWMSITILVGFAVLTFVPLRYLYPSQRGLLNRVTCLLGGVWAIAVLWVMWRLPADRDVRFVALVSLAFPIYYLAVSWIVSGRYYLRRAGDRNSPPFMAGGNTANPP